MKKILLSLCILTLMNVANAQQLLITFSKEKAQFMKDLNAFMTSNKMEQNINTMNAFEKVVKEGKVPDAWFPKMAMNCNSMSERNMTPFTHYIPYLNAVMNAAQTKQTDAHFIAWSDFISDIIEGQKKGDNNGFLKAIDFSIGFFQDGSLLATPAKSWKVIVTDYTFESGGLRPYISFPTTTILGCVKGDTLSVKQTAGDYYPLETKWEGKSGRVDWARASLDPNKVFCTFKNYSINTSNFNYTVDTVTFTHTEYFKTTLSGKLIDKMVSSADSGTISYPRFQSYDMGMTIKDVAPNVSYTGGFSLNGVKVLGYGTPEEKAILSFYSRDGKTKVLSAKSANVSIKKGEELGADKAEVSIYFGTDSIYHPQLSVVYKIPKREIRLLRGETGMGKAKFTDSYHNHEFQTDAIFWNLDSSTLNLKILSGAGQKPGVYESVNYFQKELIRRTQGYASYEPLSILKRMYEKTGSREINATELARTLDPNLKEGEIKSLLYTLVENGFILYNEDLGVITVRDKTLNYVLANAKKIDYDIIHIKSAPQTGNDFIDLKSSNIDLKGVKEVPISDSAFVYFQPKNNAISLQKDRNMQFDGLVYAGRMDMFGEKYKFQYAPFTIDLTKVDTMRINVPDSLGRLDEDGNPILQPIRSRIENLKGMLEIDAPINKSGRTRLPQFPRLYSREKSYIYYDDPTVAKGAYARKDFYFELEPFRLDSLNSFSMDMINWKGKLQSGGIFPDIKDSVHIQRDGSLGFKSETPPGGYELYKGKGKYWGKFELNYDGMKADGRITHSTADFTSHDIRLYPDSMLGTTDTIRITKTFEGVKTPSVFGTSEKIFWRPKADSMHINMMNKEQPFTMYDDSTTSFKGNLLLTAKDLRGNGLLDWSEATLESKDFAFHTMDLAADTAALNIKSTGDKVTFKTPNVNAKVDFKTRIGDFVSNQKNIPTEFSYNQYTTAINQFKWFMDEKILDFKAPPGGPGEYFTSTRPDQKGLKFLGKRATYSLITSVLRVEQVPEIRVADASVIPDSGVVIIEAEAKMHQLVNATIVADTINKTHRIEHATVDIYSKEELKGFGEYKYNTKDIKEIITFDDITCKKEREGERKKAHDIWQLTAKTTIDKEKNFVIYPNVSYTGDVNLLSANKLLNFKGYAAIGLKHVGANTSDFLIDQDVNPDKLELKYTTETKNANGNYVSAGIHLNPLEEAQEMYPTFLGSKKDPNDITLFKTTGIATINAAGEYQYGDEKKIKDKVARGNVLTYDDKKGTAKAEGDFDLGVKFGLIKTKAVGYADVMLDSAKYKFNLTIGIDANIDPKLQERLEFYMTGDNVDLADVNYETEKQRKAIQMLTDEKDDKKLLEEFEKVPVLVKRPKDFNYNLVFSDVNFVYDSFDVSLRSVGKIGVAMIGKKAINKKLEGYIEFQYKGGADVFIIYLQTGTKNWVYFEYHPGTLGVLSSYDDINTGLVAIAPDKRRITGENKRFYMYTLGSSMNKTDFVGYMADKAKGINRERVVEEIVVPVDSNMFLGDSTYVPDNITPEQRQDLKQQEEINNLEQMKMSNQNILSGPPPDRNKPKEQPKQEAPTQEVPKEQPKEEVKPEAPKQEEIKIEEVPQEEPKKKSKKKGKGDADAETEITQPEAPKVETPPVQEVPKEEPKVETPKQEELKIEDVPQEQPKKKKKKGKGDAETETTQPETPNVEVPPVQETPKTEEPK